MPLEKISREQLLARSMAEGLVDLHPIEKGGMATGVEWRPTAKGVLVQLSNRGYPAKWEQMKHREQADAYHLIDRYFNQWRRENRSQRHDRELCLDQIQAVQRNIDMLEGLLKEMSPSTRRSVLIRLRTRLLNYSSILLGVNEQFS
ncbi:MAG: hypothetical protein AABX02_05090 [archaeon]